MYNEILGLVTFYCNVRTYGCYYHFGKQGLIAWVANDTGINYNIQVIKL